MYNSDIMRIIYEKKCDIIVPQCTVTILLQLEFAACPLALLQVG
jgi:hypothetical protein